MDQQERTVLIACLGEMRLVAASSGAALVAELAEAGVRVIRAIKAQTGRRQVGAVAPDHPIGLDVELAHSGPVQHLHGRQVTQPRRRERAAGGRQQAVAICSNYPSQSLAEPRPSANAASQTGSPSGPATRRQPVRRGHSKGIQGRAQRLADALQQVHRPHRCQHTGAIRALTPISFQYSEPVKPCQHGIEQDLLNTARDRADAKLTQDGEVEPGVSKLQAQRMLSVDPTLDGVGRLLVRPALGGLQHSDKGRAPRRVRRLAAGRVSRCKHLVIVDHTQLVAHPHDRAALRERGACDLHGGGNRCDLGRM